MSLTATQAAPVVHETMRAYQHAAGQDPVPPWDEAPGWMRAATIVGVLAVITGEAEDPERAHQVWADDKRADGWTYGPVKDPDAKTHPCLVAYDELPEAEQRKDALLLAVARALTAPVAATSHPRANQCRACAAGHPLSCERPASAPGVCDGGHR